MATRYYWNDDDRKNDYISYHDTKEEEYVPVYKILKEMYDEDKAKLYIYDTEEEYQYLYGQYYFDKYCEYYSIYYDLNSTAYVDSDVDSDVDNDVQLDTNKSLEEPIVEKDNSHENDETKKVENDEYDECINEIKSKFIYT